MSAMVELAERCEKATGPSYGLDCEIWDAIYPGERDARFERLSSEGPYKGRLGPADRDGYIKPLRAFTASLDAAMTLVPEGCFWTVMNARDGQDRPIVGAGLALVTAPDDVAVSEPSQAATPALALVAAALRAHMKEGKQ